MPFFYVPLVMAIAANMLYHIFNKAIPTTVHPIASLVITYGTALITSLIMLPFFTSGTGIVGALKTVTWPSIALGIAVIGLELGYLLAYRSGWNVSLAPVIVMGTMSVLLIPIGYFLFKEHVSLVNIFGMTLCILGLFFIHYK